MMLPQQVNMQQQYALFVQRKIVQVIALLKQNNIDPKQFAEFVKGKSIKELIQIFSDVSDPNSKQANLAEDISFIQDNPEQLAAVLKQAPARYGVFSNEVAAQIKNNPQIRALYPGIDNVPDHAIIQGIADVVQGGDFDIGITPDVSRVSEYIANDPNSSTTMQMLATMGKFSPAWVDKIAKPFINKIVRDEIPDKLTEAFVANPGVAKVIAGDMRREAVAPGATKARADGKNYIVQRPSTPVQNPAQTLQDQAGQQPEQPRQGLLGEAGDFFSNWDVKTPGVIGWVLAALGLPLLFGGGGKTLAGIGAMLAGTVLVPFLMKHFGIGDDTIVKENTEPLAIDTNTGEPVQDVEINKTIEPELQQAQAASAMRDKVPDEVLKTFGALPDTNRLDPPQQLGPDVEAGRQRLAQPMQTQGPVPPAGYAEQPKPLGPPATPQEDPYAAGPQTPWAEKYYNMQQEAFRSTPKYPARPPVNINNAPADSPDYRARKDLFMNSVQAQPGNKRFQLAPQYGFPRQSAQQKLNLPQRPATPKPDDQQDQAAQSIAQQRAKLQSAAVQFKQPPVASNPLRKYSAYTYPLFGMLPAGPIMPRIKPISNISNAQGTKAKKINKPKAQTTLKGLQQSLPDYINTMIDAKPGARGLFNNAVTASNVAGYMYPAYRQSWTSRALRYINNGK